jgi:hypothetical protein
MAVYFFSINGVSASLMNSKAMAVRFTSRLAT